MLIRILPVPVVRDPNFAAFLKSKNKKDILDRINKALKKAGENGELRNIINRHELNY